MTQDTTLYQFFSGFGIPAYPSTSVPARERALCPYLTYEPVLSNWFSEQPAYPTVNIYYRTDSESTINAKAREIMSVIGGGLCLECDEGALWIYFDGVWTPINDPTDPAIKQRYTTLTIRFDTV